MDLFTTIAQGRIRHTSTILQQDGHSVNTRSHDGKTPLIFAVCEAQDDVRSHLLRMLIRSGCDVNAQDNCGRTALMYASMDAEKIDLVRVLSRCKDCSPNVQDKEGNTAVFHAIMCANSAAIKILVNSTTTKSQMNLELRNKQGLNALEMGVKLQMTDCCKILLYEGGANTKHVKNQVGLMRLMEDENLLNRSHTPHSRNPSRNAFINRRLSSPIPENRQFEGSYMSRDATPNYVDDFPGHQTPMNELSRSNSLHRTNSNLYKRRPEAGSRPVSLHSGNDIIDLLQSQKNMKRVLTPISARNGNAAPSFPEKSDDISRTPDDRSSLGRTRLPSIPSGRKLYLVSSQNNYNCYDSGHNV